MHISTRLILGGSQENTVLSCEGQVRRGHAVALVYGPIYGPEGSLYDRAAAFRAAGEGISHQPSAVSQQSVRAGLGPGVGATATEPRASSMAGLEASLPPARNSEPGTRNSPTPSRRIELIETPNLVRELAPLKDRRCLRDLRRIIRDWKPDVVHTHSSKAGILGRLAAWKERAPCVIHTIHGLPFHPYEKKWRNAVYILSERIAARRCHRIVCVADAMRDQALAAGIGRPEQYVTVYSGMEIDSFLHPRWTREQVRRELGVAEHEFILGTVARLAELKGHDDLIDALGPLMHERPSLRLLWVGDGWWRDRLFARLKDAGLEGRVITTGLVPPEEVPKYVQAMDCLAHPSYREGLPRTVPQALLSARPVIAYDVDGTKECCRDGETGRLVKPGDLPGLCEAVRWMMDHPKERTAMGVAGRELCRTRFSAETMVDELERVYASVLEHRGGRSAGRGDRR